MAGAMNLTGGSTGIQGVWQYLKWPVICLKVLEILGFWICSYPQTN